MIRLGQLVEDLGGGRTVEPFGQLAGLGQKGRPGARILAAPFDDGQRAAASLGQPAEYLGALSAGDRAGPPGIRAGRNGQLAKEILGLRSGAAWFMAGWNP